MLDITNAAFAKTLTAELPDLDGLFNFAGVVYHGNVLDLTDSDGTLQKRYLTIHVS